MYDEDVLACQREIRRLRNVVRELEAERECHERLIAKLAVGMGREILDGLSYEELEIIRDCKNM